MTRQIKEHPEFKTIPIVVLTVMLYVILSLFIPHTGTLANEQSTDVINVGVLENWPPQFLTDSKTGNPKGFAIEIMEKAAELANLKVRYITYKSWPQIHQAIKKREIAVVPNMGIIQERKDIYNFTMPYETFQISTFVRSTTANINSLEDLKGRHVGVVKDNKGIILMQNRGGSTLNIYPSLEEAFLSLLSGNIDALVYPEPVILKMALNSGLEDKIKKIGLPLFEVKRGIAIRKDEQEIHSRLNEAIKEIIKSHDLSHIYEKWFGKPKPFWNMRRSLITMAIVLTGISTILLIFHYRSVLKLNRRLYDSIAELNLMQESLKESESLLKKTQSIAHIGTWRLDLKTKELFWSDEVYRIFGMDPETFEASYEAFLKAVHPDDKEKVEQAYAIAIKEQKPYEITHRIQRKDGEVRFVHEKSEDIRDESGQIVTSIGMVHDITEIMRTEIKLLESESRYRNVYETAPLAFVVWDSQCKIMEWNVQAEKMFGYKRSEVLGENFFDLIIPDIERESIERVVKNLLDGKIEEHVTNQNNTKNGDLIWCEWKNSILRDGEGRVTAAISLGLNITERINTEKELTKYRKHLEDLVEKRTLALQAKNRELEMFTYSVSHDLKAPLRGIDGYSRLLSEEYTDKLDEEGLFFLNNVRKGAAQMNQLIEDLLAYSKTERKELNLTSIDLKPLIDSIFTQRVHDIEQRRIDFKIEIPFQTIKSDLETIRQVLANYLDNAIKYSKKDEPGTVIIGGSEDNEYWTLWVKDCGIGFDPQYIDRIFEIFQRLHNVEEYPGTGVGLAIVRKAVERVGGRVRANSAPGKGATFYLEIPKHGSF